MDNLLYDLGQRLYIRSSPSDIIIVAIDEESLSKLGRWPWSRHQHAILINHLKRDGARVIGLDLIFAEPDVADPSSDEALSEAIHYAGNVVLPVLLENGRVNGQIVETLPLPSFSESAAAMGHVHIELDEDGIARSVFLWVGLNTPVWPHFAQAVLKVANISLPIFLTSPPKQSQQNLEPYILVREDQRRISLLGKPGHVQRLSYAHVVKGEFPTGIFKNKIVLVGATASGMGDFIPTPVSGLHQLMSGVEFQANIIDSIMHDRLVRQTPNWITILVSVLLAILPVIWLPRLGPLLGLLGCSLWAAAIVGISVLLPNLFGVWFPPSAALLPIALAYPVWGWLKLDAAQRYLDQELQLLHNDAAWVENHIGIKNKIHDQMQLRILHVQLASQRFRQLHEDRLETLAFISHDIRAPLVAAIMHLDENIEPATECLRGPLAQALELAEDFLYTSRAEMIDTSLLQEIDITAILHQTIDDAYSVAHRRSVHLMREIPVNPVWLNGDFGLLHRAVLNLVLNAIKFSPSGATVTLALNISPKIAIVSVIDYGPGISEDQQKNLFKRFNRSGSNAGMTEGTGLGLYFVHAVAVKHGGNVEVLSEPGSFTRFTIQLPLAPHFNTRSPSFKGEEPLPFNEMI